MRPATELARAFAVFAQVQVQPTPLATPQNITMRARDSRESRNTFRMSAEVGSFLIGKRSGSTGVLRFSVRGGEGRPSKYSLCQPACCNSSKFLLMFRKLWT